MSPGPAPSSVPSLHIRPSRGWLNDPNGMVHVDGVWHVFFQHNPARAQHGDIHWGHVSSTDLVRWHEHPVAFGPEPGGPDRGGCWSGAFVRGLRAPAVVYTGITDGPTGSTVCLRYAADPALERWSAPLVVATEPDGVDLREMRDPFPFTWHGRPYAVLGAGLRDGTPALLLFSCDDPQAWRFERVWLDGSDPVLGPLAPADIWECPQLVQVDGSWVVIVSLWTDGRLERVVAGVADLTSGPDGLPVLTVRSGGDLDAGPVFYAPQVASDPDGPLLLGWVRQDDAPEGAPDDAVAGCLTLPRRLALGEGAEAGRVVSRPDPALLALVGEEVPADGSLPLACRVVLDPADGVEGGARVTLLGSEGEVDLGVDRRTELWLDGEVLEVYPDHGVPQTHRQPGTTSWGLTTHHVDARVRALVAPGRA